MLRDDCIDSSIESIVSTIPAIPSETEPMPICTDSSRPDTESVALSHCSIVVMILIEFALGRLRDL